MASKDSPEEQKSRISRIANEVLRGYTITFADPRMTGQFSIQYAIHDPSGRFAATSTSENSSVIAGWSDEKLSAHLRALVAPSISSVEPVPQTTTKMKTLKRMEPQHKEAQFLLKVGRFVESWSALVREYNEKGALNAKTAREASKAFHDLEKSEGWPK